MRVLPSIAASALCGLAASAHASPVDLFGFGARGEGMAGAIQATATGFESVYYNPAGLAFDLRPTFALGYQLGTFDLLENGEPFHAIDAPALNIGFGVPIPFGGALAHRVSIGLGFTIPQTSILITDIEAPGDPTFVLVENRAQTVSIQGALGIRLFDGLSLGVGTLALAELEGEIGVAPNASGRIGSKVKDELIADYALVAGLMLRPLAFDGCAENDQRLAVSLTWRSESRADFTLPITADLGAQFSIPIPTIDVSGTAQFDPAEASIEVAGRPLPWLLVAAGATWEKWSTFPLPIGWQRRPAGHAAAARPRLPRHRRGAPRRRGDGRARARPAPGRARRLRLRADAGAGPDRLPQPPRQRPLDHQRRLRCAPRHGPPRPRRPVAVAGRAHLGEGRGHAADQRRRAEDHLVGRHLVPLARARGRAVTRRIPTLVLALGLVVACLVRGPRAAASPFDYYPQGARAMGLGGAYGALADDFSANHYNPAGLATKDELQLELGYMFIQPTLELDGKNLEVDETRGFVGGVVLPGHAWGRRLALSLSIYLPDERVTRLRALPESQPRFVLYDNNPQRIVLTTSFAFEIVKDLLYTGIGLTYLSDTQGALKVKGQVDFLDADGTTLLSAVDVDFKAVRYLSAGILVRPTRDLRIGLAFQDEFDLTLNIGLVVNGDIVVDGASGNPSVLVPGATLVVGSRNSNLFSPRQLTLAIAWSPGRWTFTAQATWYQWSRFISPTAHLTTSIDAGDLPLAIPPNPDPIDPGFSDIVVPRVGVEVRAAEGAHVALDLRAGAWFEASPAPPQTGLTNFADGDKLGFGLGFSLEFKDFSEVFPRPLHLDVGALFAWMPEREHLKSDPADAVGDYVSSGNFVGLSTSLRFAF
ncbi:MAG: outer membrane protein transport protein [Myxococcota bacterium]